MRQGGHVAAPGCEWDTPGGFTKAVPVIHKTAFPDHCAFQAVMACQWPLKRPFMLQPVVEDRSVQVVIGGERTWQSQRLMEADFNG